MHNMALELLSHGNTVTGSDDEIFDPAKSRLAAAGILPEKYGWFPEKIHNNLDGIILGMHARIDNPELLRAKELGIPVYSFPEFVFEHSRNKKRVVIGGSHGKTTCTAMLMHVLADNGMDFDYLVGSQLEGFDRMVKLSDAPVIVIEGDEYLTSALDPVPKFHRYHPHLAMITGIAWDHINVFPTYENYIDQFRIFIKTMEPDGSLFWFSGDEDLCRLASEFIGNLEPYQCPEFESKPDGAEVITETGRYQLKIFGRHNLENAAGVCRLANKLGISTDQFWNSMQSFGGTARRLEKIEDSENLVVFRDFAHAPSKVKATVEAVREQYPDADLLALFELHTYSSLRADFMPRYHGTLAPADSAMVLYDPHVFELKKMPVPEKSTVESAIGDCTAFDNPTELLNAWRLKLAQSKGRKVLLIMSSGNLGGIPLKEFY